jgi:hypothetical protein
LVEAAFHGDGDDFGIGFAEHLGGFFESDLHFKLGEGAAEFVLDEAGEVTSGAVALFGEGAGGEVDEGVVGEVIEERAESGGGVGVGVDNGGRGGGFAIEEEGEDEEEISALGEGLGGEFLVEKPGDFLLGGGGGLEDAMALGAFAEVMEGESVGQGEERGEVVGLELEQLGGERGGGVGIEVGVGIGVEDQEVPGEEGGDGAGGSAGGLALGEEEEAPGIR